MCGNKKGQNNMKSIKKILVAAILLTMGATPMVASGSKKINAFEYYSDGIYDAYLQIDRDIKKGMSERYMSEFSGQYLVGIDIGKASTVDIIYYQTIGAKNSLEPVTVKHVRSGRNFLIFDKFPRKADAKMLQKKLTKYSLAAKIYEKANTRTYRRNPVVIKKLIMDLEDMIKNTPVKIIAIEKASSSYRMTGQKKSLPTASLNEYLRLKKSFCRSSSIGNRELSIGKSTYLIGDSIGTFKISNITTESGEDTVVLGGEDHLSYRLKKSLCYTRSTSGPKEIRGTKFKTSRENPAEIKTEPKPKCNQYYDENAKNNRVVVAAKPVKTSSNGETKAKPRTQNSTQSTQVRSKEEPKSERRQEQSQVKKVYGEFDERKMKCDFSKIHTIKTTSGGDKMNIETTSYAARKGAEDTIVKKLKDGTYSVRVTGMEPVYIEARPFRRHCK